MDGEGAGNDLRCLAQALALWAYCGLALATHTKYKG
jgi:hypothetical protein